MLIDGRAIANKLVSSIKAEIVSLGIRPKLTVFTCTPNFETRKFLSIKQKQATEAGIHLDLIELPSTVTLSEIKAKIASVQNETDGLIVQFPFPHLTTTDVIGLLPSEKDVDVFSYPNNKNGLLPPVIGAIAYIADECQTDWSNKDVVIVGEGRLVGRPSAVYLQDKGAKVTVITKEKPDLTPLLSADVVIAGAGVPGLIKSEHLRKGVVVFDAGTSEEGGVLVGDVDKEVSEIASWFTPVPGGIGPVAVAILLKNVLELAKMRGQ
jgi:5,10-methylene-tetrahydrofolate dehydrogenase/methenyl tetrahydrofolate cyclohydrolase